MKKCNIRISDYNQVVIGKDKYDNIFTKDMYGGYWGYSPDGTCIYHRNHNNEEWFSNMKPSYEKPTSNRHEDTFYVRIGMDGKYEIGF